MPIEIGNKNLKTGDIFEFKIKVVGELGTYSDESKALEVDVNSMVADVNGMSFSVVVNRDDPNNFRLEILERDTETD